MGRGNGDALRGSPKKYWGPVFLTIKTLFLPTNITRRGFSIQILRGRDPKGGREVLDPELRGAGQGQGRSKMATGTNIPDPRWRPEPIWPIQDGDRKYYDVTKPEVTSQERK